MTDAAPIDNTRPAKTRSDKLTMICGYCGQEFKKQLPLNRKEQECPCGFINVKKKRTIRLCTRCGKDCYGDSHMCAECWGIHSAAFVSKEEVGRKRSPVVLDDVLPGEDDKDD